MTSPRTDLSRDVPSEQAERLLKFRSTSQQRQVKAGKTTWNYLVCGDGDTTVLLLPGEERREDLVFPLIQAWEQEYRVVCPLYPAVPTIEQLVDGLALLLEKEQIASVYLVGISFGGNLAQCFIRKFPERVKGLVLQNAAVPERGLARPVEVLEKVMTFMPGSMVRSLLQQMMTQVLATPPGEQAFWRACVHELAFHSLTKKDALALLRETIDYRRNYSFSPDDLLKWPGKILIIESNDDRPITPAMRAALKAAYPQAQVQTFRRGGHTPFLLQAEQYHALVGGFLKGTGS